LGGGVQALFCPGACPFVRGPPFGFRFGSVSSAPGGFPPVAHAQRPQKKRVSSRSKKQKAKSHRKKKGKNQKAAGKKEKTKTKNEKRKKKKEQCQ